MKLAALYRFATQQGFEVATVSMDVHENVTGYTTDRAVKDPLQTLFDEHRPPGPRTAAERDEATDADMGDPLRTLADEFGWQSGASPDVVARIGHVLGELVDDRLDRPAAVDFLVALFNDFVDDSNRRIRCDAVIVAPDGVKGPGDGPVVGYALNQRLFSLDGRPFPNMPVEYGIIEVDNR